MRRPLLLAAAGLAAAALTATAGPSSAAPSPSAHSHGHKRICSAAPKAGTASCNAEVQTRDGNVTPNATSSYSSGYSPAQLQTAYKVTYNAAAGTGTIAIVDAYAHPNAEADLAVYRKQFGLSTLNTPGNPTFRQINQTGGTTLPAGDTGWGQEEMLDLEMASAICPQCNILYVGANSAGFTDLSTATSQARSQGADVISNSYGGSEFSTERNYTAAYTPTDTVVTISSGDSGYGPQFPAAAQGPNTFAVGGTNLTLNSGSTRKTETVWTGAGSGCSSFIAKPTWQKDTGCSRRTIADIAAVADPATGVAVYDSYGSTGGNNWYVFGGTSVAAPIIASDYAASGFRHHSGAATTKALYAASSNSTGTATLFDVTSGSNGRCKTSVAYLCTGKSGYDGPTGKGTPNASLPLG